MASFRRAQIFLADGKMWGLLRRQGRVIPETHVPLEPAHWFRVQVVSIIITPTMVSRIRV